MSRPAHRVPVPFLLVFLVITLAACGSSGDAADDAVTVDSDPAAADARAAVDGRAPDSTPVDASDPGPDAGASFACTSARQCGGYPCCGALLADSRFEIVSTTCGVPSCPAETVTVCETPAECAFEFPSCIPAGDGTGLSVCRAD